MKLLLPNDAVTIIPEAKKTTIALLFTSNCRCYSKIKLLSVPTVRASCFSLCFVMLYRHLIYQLANTIIYRKHNIHDTLLYNLNVHMLILI